MSDGRSRVCCVLHRPTSAALQFHTSIHLVIEISSHARSIIFDVIFGECDQRSLTRLVPRFLHSPNPRTSSKGIRTIIIIIIYRFQCQATDFQITIRQNGKHEGDLFDSNVIRILNLDTVANTSLGIYLLLRFA